MDNVTHTLVGLTLARTRLGRAGRGSTVALALASNAPDIDIVTIAGGGSAYLHWHRGPTHGPLGIVGLGVATAGLVWLGQRFFDKRAAGNANAPFMRLVLLSMLGVLVHVLMDLPTSYGTRALSPFSWHWFSLDWMPIIDIYLIAVLGAALFFGRGSDAMRRQNVKLALVLMLVDYGVRGAAHHEAIALAPRAFGPTLPAPCGGNPPPDLPVERWPLPPTAPAEPGAHRCLVELAAMPGFLSPFSWGLIAQTSNSYETLAVDLLDQRYRQPRGEGEVLWRRTVRYPNVWTPAALSAASAPLAHLFLGFSRFPVVRTTVDGAGTTTVRWSDMRFAMSRGGPPPGVPGRTRDAGIAASAGNFFAVTVRLAPDGFVLGETFGR